MRIKKDYILREIAGTYVVFSLAQETVAFDGMLRLNESGVLLWRALEKGSDVDSLAKILTTEYNVKEKQARMDIEEFVNKLIQLGCVEC